MHYYKTERHYATYHFTVTILEQDNKNVNNTRKLFREILKENSQKTGIYPSKIFPYLKGLSKALEICQNTIVGL
ncbi:hypothetical protein QIA27_05270 (plasmid) [Borreliella tanukii]|uniref:hypothetical protein n=1 Tax=Borreliella tanukii TaxID=56146 RepID=UPI003AF0A5FF